MNRIILALFALVAVCSAYRPYHHNSELRQGNHYEHENHHHEPHWRYNDARSRRGLLHHPMTADVVRMFSECRREAWQSDSGKSIACIIACTMQKIGEMSENGKLNEKKIIEDIQFKAKMEEKIARSCIAKVHADDVKGSCDVAGDYLKCVVEKTFNMAKE